MGRYSVIRLPWLVMVLVLVALGMVSAWRPSDEVRGAGRVRVTRYAVETQHGTKYSGQDGAHGLGLGLSNVVGGGVVLTEGSDKMEYQFADETVEHRSPGWLHVTRRLVEPLMFWADPTISSSSLPEAVFTFFLGAHSGPAYVHAPALVSFRVTDALAITHDEWLITRYVSVRAEPKTAGGSCVDVDEHAVKVYIYLDVSGVVWRSTRSKRSYPAGDTSMPQFQIGAQFVDCKERVRGREFWEEARSCAKLSYDLNFMPTSWFLDSTTAGGDKTDPERERYVIVPAKAPPLMVAGGDPGTDAAKKVLHELWPGTIKDTFSTRLSKMAAEARCMDGRVFSMMSVEADGKTLVVGARGSYTFADWLQNTMSSQLPVAVSKDEMNKVLTFGRKKNSRGQRTEAEQPLWYSPDWCERTKSTKNCDAFFDDSNGDVLRDRDEHCNGNACVHRGFYWKTAISWPTIRSAMERVLSASPEITRVIFTGHSQGGALAQLLAHHYVLSPPPSATLDAREGLRVPVVYTFAAPTVGNDHWARAFLGGLGLEGRSIEHRRFRFMLDTVPMIMNGQLKMKGDRDGPSSRRKSIFSYEHAAESGDTVQLTTGAPFAPAFCARGWQEPSCMTQIGAGHEMDMNDFGDALTVALGNPGYQGALGTCDKDVDAGQHHYAGNYYHAVSMFASRFLDEGKAAADAQLPAWYSFTAPAADSLPVGANRGPVDLDAALKELGGAGKVQSVRAGGVSLNNRNKWRYRHRAVIDAVNWHCAGRGAGAPDVCLKTSRDAVFTSLISRDKPPCGWYEPNQNNCLKRYLDRVVVRDGRGGADARVSGPAAVTASILSVKVVHAQDGAGDDDEIRVRVQAEGKRSHSVDAPESTPNGKTWTPGREKAKKLESTVPVTYTFIDVDSLFNANDPIGLVVVTRATPPGTYTRTLRGTKGAEWHVSFAVKPARGHTAAEDGLSPV